MLRDQIGVTFQEAIANLRLGKADANRCMDEPIGYLRGVKYVFYGRPSPRTIILFIAPEDNMYKHYSPQRKWSCADIEKARIGGVQAVCDENVIEFGAIPFQWSLVDCGRQPQAPTVNEIFRHLVDDCIIKRRFFRGRGV
jgi:hypothetical protein